MISLKQIHYILALEKTLHFKKAADLCSVSQSALSTAITEMEKQLGFQIFERDNKKVLITSLGRQCLDKAHHIKIQMNDLYLLGQIQKKPLSYPMSLGIIPTIGPYLLPKTLPAVRHTYPDLKLRIVEAPSRPLIDMVKNGELDTAILALPYDTEKLLTFKFWQEDFYWISHKEDNHSFTEITHDDIKYSNIMLLQEGHCLKDHILAACRLQASETDNSLASTSLHTLIQMVAGRMGTTLIPAMALDQLLIYNPELQAAHLKEPGPHRSIAFLTRPNYTGMHHIELLMQIFRQQLNKTLPKDAKQPKLC